MAFSSLGLDEGDGFGRDELGVVGCFADFDEGFEEHVYDVVAE